MVNILTVLMYFVSVKRTASSDGNAGWWRRHVRLHIPVDAQHVISSGPHMVGISMGTEPLSVTKLILASTTLGYKKKNLFRFPLLSLFFQIKLFLLTLHWVETNFSNPLLQKWPKVVCWDISLTSMECITGKHCCLCQMSVCFVPVRKWWLIFFLIVRHIRKEDSCVW